MNTDRDTLEDQLQECEQKLGGFKSFIKELTDRAAEHGTDDEHFEEDLHEAKHNVEYYEGAVARIKAELKEHGGSPRPKGGVPRPGGGGGSILPRPSKPTIESLIISSISFVAGAFLGSKMKSRREDKDAPGEKTGG